MNDVAIHRSTFVGNNMVSRRGLIKLGLASAATGALTMNRTQLLFAQDATPASVDGVSIDVLSQVTIAAGVLTASIDSILLAHLRLREQSSSTWIHRNTAIQVLHPLEGEIVMPVTGKTEIVHEGGGIEALDTGVAFKAGPADTVIGYDLSLPKTYANSADTPVDWLEVLFAEGANGVNDYLLLETGLPLEFPNAYWQANYDFAKAGLIGLPLLVTMRRVTLEPGAKIDAEDQYATIRLIEGGRVEYTLIKDGVLAGDPIRMFTSVPYFEHSPGTVIELANRDADTTMFYELLIGPAGNE